MNEIGCFIFSFFFFFFVHLSLFPLFVLTVHCWSSWYVWVEYELWNMDFLAQNSKFNRRNFFPKMEMERNSMIAMDLYIILFYTWYIAYLLMTSWVFMWSRKKTVFWRWNHFSWLFIYLLHFECNFLQE